MDKLYVLVREDLSSAQKAVQACHAVAEFALRYGDMISVIEWSDKHKTIVIVETDMDGIYKSFTQLSGTCSILQGFHDPDMGDALTAFACLPDKNGKKLLSKFKLILEERP